VEPGIERLALQPCLETAAGGLILLEAPAGYGKTQVLAQWCRRARHARHTVAWISLQSAEESATLLARRLVETLREAGVRGLPAVGTIGTAAAEAAGRERFAVAFLEAVVRHRRRVLLVLDDYQTAEHGGCDELLERLLERLPRNLTVALATRRSCPIVLSRVQLQGRLQRLDKRALSFSKAEARSFLGTAVWPAQFSPLYWLTEGWPAALEMARVCLPDWHNPRTDIYNVPGFSRLVGDYCSAEILRHESPAALELLIECSVTETLEPALCDAIRRQTDSASILANLAAHETFLEPVDLGANRWRLPRLLQRVLSRRAAGRGADFLVTAHSRAAEYLESTGQMLPALRHYLDAQRPAAAASALERASPINISVLKGDSYVQELLDLIPDEQLRGFPRLGLCRVYLDFKQGMLDEARLLMAELAGRTGNFTVDRPGGDDLKLKAEALCVRLIIEFYGRSHAPMEYLRSIEQEQLPIVSKGDSILLTLVHLILGLLYALRGDLDAAQTHFIQCEKLNARERSPWNTVWLKYHNGMIALARGHLTEARYNLQAGLKLWTAQFRTYPAYRAMAQLALAEIDYETDARRAAQTRLDESLYTAEHVEGWFEPYAAVYEMQMMIHWHAGRIDKIEALLARSVVVQRVGALLERFLHSLRLRFELLRGCLGAAQAIVDCHRLDQSWAADTFQDEFTYREWDIVGSCLCVLAVRKDMLHAAAGIAERLERVSSLAGRARTLARALALRSVIAHRRGDEDHAVALLQSALEVGHAEGYRRVFLDEADLVRPVLEALCSRGSAIPAHLASYAQTLGATQLKTDKEAIADKACPLSEREHEVLRELSQGYSNKLIARKLGLSTPTVNFHVRNVFQKLGVHRRASATAEAHRRGWLS
jgi:LuxR family maltose regulon positive regulatory protein